MTWFFPAFFFLLIYVRHFSYAAQIDPLPKLKNRTPLAAITREILQEGWLGNKETVRKHILDWNERAKTLVLEGHASCIFFDDLLCEIDKLEEHVVDPGITHQIFAQSYSSFALALAFEKDIALIPAGCCDISFLSSSGSGDECFYHSELFFQKNISIAFTAPYSDPWIARRLQKQSITTYTLPYPSEFEQLGESFEIMGNALGEKSKSSLIQLFLKGAKRALLNESRQIKQLKSLFLHAGHRFSLPLAGTLLQKRLEEYGLIPEMSGKELSYEEIIDLNPDVLILSCFHPEDPKTQSNLFRRLQSVECVQKGHVYFVDEHLQQFPSQHALLADLELLEALLSS